MKRESRQEGREGEEKMGERKERGRKKGRIGGERMGLLFFMSH